MKNFLLSCNALLSFKTRSEYILAHYAARRQSGDLEEIRDSVMQRSYFGVIDSKAPSMKLDDAGIKQDCHTMFIHEAWKRAVMSSNLRAIFVCFLAYTCFDAMGVHVRILSESYSPQELSVYRNILGVLPSLLLLAYTGELTLKLNNYKIKRWKLALGRGLFVAVAQLLLYSALARLELATVSALGQTNAIFVVLLAILFYGETVGLWRWMAVIFGFSGALLIMQPGTDFFVWSSLLPIGAAFCYAASIVSLRSFDKEVSNSILYLYSASAAAAGAIVMALGTTEFSPIASTSDALLILSMSICGGFGVVFLMHAFRNAPASVLAPFSYFGILTSFGFGWLFFAEFPVDKLFPGVVLIIASGLTILWRERRQNSEHK